MRVWTGEVGVDRIAIDRVMTGRMEASDNQKRELSSQKASKGQSGYMQQRRKT